MVGEVADGVADAVVDAVVGGMTDAVVVADGEAVGVLADDCTLEGVRIGCTALEGVPAGDGAAVVRTGVGGVPPEPLRDMAELPLLW